MGWKAFNLFATVRDESYLTSFPPPLPERAREFLKLLGGTFRSEGATTLEKGLYPAGNDELYVGAYEGAFVLGSIPITEEAFAGVVPKAVTCVNTMLPGCRVLIVLLHSVVDLFGYAIFEHNRLVRARAGSADSGVYVDFGDLLPIERKLKAFDDTIDGEELVMEISRPFIGCRIDEYNSWDLGMELFRRSR